MPGSTPPTRALSPARRRIGGRSALIGGDVAAELKRLRGGRHKIP
jgi:hypothetical protein